MNNISILQIAATKRLLWLLPRKLPIKLFFVQRIYYQLLANSFSLTATTINCIVEKFRESVQNNVI